MSENKKRNNRVLKLCVAALMAALVALSSKLQIQIPAILGVQRFHLGNSMCALSGILLGPWWGGLAAGVGSMIFDLFDPRYLPEAPITFITKGIYGVVAGLMFVKVFKRRSNYGTELVSTLCAAVTYIVLYLTKNYFYNGMLIAGLDSAAAWAAVVQKVPSSVFNGLVAVVFAPILGVAINKALKSAHLERVLE
ncbi:MAG: ECF transporter S component [Candidatus Enterenecus sp.]